VPLTVYVLDDERIAVSRLARMLSGDARVSVVGSSTNPVRAVDEIRTLGPDALFIDIEMPGQTGFDVLHALGDAQPLVVFTTAFEHYALEAFRVNSIDYLLKPIEQAALERAIGKLERLTRSPEPRPDVLALLEQVRTALESAGTRYLDRVASRTGPHVTFVDVAEVTHFYTRDRLTFAATAAKDHAIDLSLADLEQRLPPARWLRIHRSTLVNVEMVAELQPWFGGKLVLGLKNGTTRLTVARDRVADVRARLGA
jgi:two-component system LytT family response regulator